MSILPILHSLINKQVSPLQKTEHTQKPHFAPSRFLAMPNYDLFEKSKNGKTFSDETFQKAKNIVMQSILEENPKESMVFILNDRIVYQEIGEKSYVTPSKCALSLIDNPENQVVMIHSHPNLPEFGNYAPSLSFDDFNFLILSKGAKSIYAINSKGEFAALEKMGDTKVSQKRISKFEKMYKDELKQKSMLFIRQNEEIYRLADEINEKLARGEKIENLDKLIRDIQEKTDYTNRMVISKEHNFWQNHSHLFNLKYDTNFSYFI